MTFYEKLSHLCQKKGTSVTKVATSLGFSASAGSTWKHMNGMPRNSTLKKIADHFDMTIEELLENVDTRIELDLKIPQTQDAMSNSVIHDNHGVIGNANAPVNISNGDATLSAHETELISMFRKLSVIKQAQLLVKAAELLDSESAKD